MERLINLLCQYAAYALDSRQILDTRSTDALKTAKLFEQALPPLRTYPLNRLQGRGSITVFSALTMTGNGKSMCLVPKLLNQVQCR